MRDPKRLDKFYRELKALHKNYASDWRFGQTMCNYMRYCYEVAKVDPFFFEEDKFLKSFKEFFEWAFEQ